MTNPATAAAARWFGRLLIFVLIAAHAGSLRAVAPDDPKVQALLEKAIAYLEKPEHQDSYGKMLGGKCLAGLAVYKYRKNAQHPIVLDAVQVCQTYAANPNQQVPNDFNYSLALSIIFLCEVDAQKYSAEIQSLLNWLRARQHPHGFWGYPDRQTGDTSQTQYGALATWVAHVYGYTSRRQDVANYANWLSRTQDPSGAFAYQAEDPGVGNAGPTSQNGGGDGLRLTMSPAAISALYMAADLLKISIAPTSSANAQDQVFQKVQDPSAAAELNVGALRRAIERGGQYFEGAFKIDPGRDRAYYFYSVERYNSFHENAEGTEIAEPKWYNQGVDFLASRQEDSGAWDDTRGRYIGTSFYALFLMRSTKMTIQETAAGSLVGGRYLPDDLTKIRVDGGQVIGTDVSRDLGSLMELLDSGEALDTQSLVASVDSFTLRSDKKPDVALENLKKMVSGENYQARLLAVRALSNAGQLDNVPVLIYAVGDPDFRVSREAHDGLRLVSRRLSVAPLPKSPTPADKRAAQLAWRQWLKSVRPDIEVSDEIILPPQ